MARQTKAMLEKEAGLWKKMYYEEANKRIAAEKEVEFFKHYSNQGHQSAMCIAMERICEAMTKAMVSK